MKREILRMERVTCVEQGRKLLNNFNFQLFEGEVMGLVPLDSYGLDEFVDCVQNNRQLLYGSVYIREKLVNTYEVRPRDKNNVYSIFRDENLIQGLTAADNVFLIRRGYRGFFINDSLIQKQLKKLGQDMEIEIRAGKRVREMADLEKYVIEIVKAYIGKADIVILQDIGSSLHIEDMGKIEKVIRYYAGKGLSFIYISARTEELDRLCDRVSVMSHGRIIKVLEQNKMKESLEKYYFFPHQPAEISGTNTRKEGEKIFRCENLCYKSIQNLSFDVERGECLLVRDSNKSDWRDFISVLSGAKLQQGMIWQGNGRGRKARRRTAVILENPTETMLFPEMSCEDNLCLTLDHRIGRLWWSKKKRRNIAREIFGREVAGKVKDLSLKEKYELVYYRILLQTPDIVFCFFPYRNVDRETHQFTNEFLKKFLSKNIAVVIITLDTLEGVSLADRII